jgi:hypothetical protein
MGSTYSLANPSFSALRSVYAQFIEQPVCQGEICEANMAELIETTGIISISNGLRLAVLRGLPVGFFYKL